MNCEKKNASVFYFLVVFCRGDKIYFVILKNNKDSTESQTTRVRFKFSEINYNNYIFFLGKLEQKLAKFCLQFK